MLTLLPVNMERTTVKDDDIASANDPRQIALFREETEDCDSVGPRKRLSDFVNRPKSDRAEDDLPDPEQELIVATSGGKDSAAMALWLKFESGLPNPMRFVFNDTGHEHLLTHQFLEMLADKIGQPIERSEAKYDFLSLAKHKGRFPSAKARFCTTELKVLPMQRWIESEDLQDPVLCQGIRAGESERRSKMTVWDDTLGDFGGHYDIWRPILRWSIDDVFAIHKRHDLKPNKLYLLGAGRVGCWPCIHVRKGELRNAFRRDPGLLERLSEYERQVREENISRGRRPDATFLEPDYTPIRFHDGRGETKDGRKYTYASIEATHAYLMGTDNLSLFEDGEDDPPACMSQYGLCE